MTYILGWTISIASIAALLFGAIWLVVKFLLFRSAKLKTKGMKGIDLRIMSDGTYIVVRGSLRKILDHPATKEDIARLEALNQRAVKELNEGIE